MSAFLVQHTTRRPVVTYENVTVTLYEGDDWYDAEVAHSMGVAALPGGRSDMNERVTFEGLHPSHVIDGARCVECMAPANGCFKIHAPCGYDTDSRAIVETMQLEGARRA